MQIELAELQAILSELKRSDPALPMSTGANLVLGKSYFIRTVTFHYTGRLIGLSNDELLLEDAAWVADSGRFAIALKSGELSEVEPYPDKVIVMKSAVVDVCEWCHELPRVQK